MRKTHTSYTKSRYRQFLVLMVEKYQPLCALCSKPFDLEVDTPTRGLDLLTEHHADGNHYNSDLSNRVLVHRTCQKSYHAKDNILFWRQFK